MQRPAIFIGLSLLLLAGCSKGAQLTLTSPAFADGAALPALYTCDSAASISPPLSIGNVPGNAKSLGILMHDTDVPMPEGFLHWAVWNVPKNATVWMQGEVPVGALQGINDASASEYTAPCPPPGPAHHYVFEVFAYDEPPTMWSGASRTSIEEGMHLHVIAHRTLTGTYARSATAESEL